MLGLKRSSYWQHVNPVAAIADFREVFRQAGRNRWRIGFASAAVTLSLFWAVGHESWRAPPPAPKIVYINSWPADRSEAETRQFIEANQKRKDEIAAARAERDEEVRRIYRKLGEASGMDVAAIEEKAAAEAKASEAARAEAVKTLTTSQTARDQR